MALLNKLAVKTRMFDGLARVVMFPDFDLDTLTEATTLADIFNTGGVDLGEIVGVRLHGTATMLRPTRSRTLRAAQSARA